MREIREVLEECLDRENLLSISLENLADAIEHLLSVLDEAENEIAEYKDTIISLEDEIEDLRSREYKDE